jgi:hypothetical protein
LLAFVLVIALGIAAWLWLGRGAPTTGGTVSGELLGQSTSSDAPGRGVVQKSAPVAQPALEQPAEASSDNALRDAGSEELATVESLLAQADEAYDAGELFRALPLYKEVAVRLQVQLNGAGDESVQQELQARLEEIKQLVRDSEEGLRAAAPAPDLATRIPHPPPREGEIPEFMIKELGNFPYDDEKGGVPADVAALDGSVVRLTGYMLPAYQTDQIKQFTLVADVYQCCFGQPPGVEHTINVVLPEGKAVPFSYGEIQVTGTLRIVEERRDGYVVNLFTLDEVTSVRATGRQ